MDFANTRASHDASERSDFFQDQDLVQDDQDIFWLEPHSSRARDFARRSVRRLAASVSVGIALNFSSAGIAFAPSAQALEDTSADTLTASFVPAPEPVEVAPSFQAFELRTAPTAEVSLPLPDVVDAAPIVVTGIPAANHAAPVIDMDCDESEVAEVHRNQVRQLLADGFRSNEPVEFAGVKVPRRIVEAVLRASEVTGADPVYMMALADKESSFSTDVKASSSSAEGLFQFIVKTWLEVVREFGPRHGLHAEAAAVEVVQGDPKVADQDMRERILRLRRDPYLSAVMAAELLNKDRRSIAQRIGRDLRQTEYYLTHFFGVDAAGRFMKLLDGKPKQSARRVFPQAAKANKPLFFAKKGKKTKDLTVAEVYAKIDRMIDARIDRYRSVTKLTVPEGSASAI